jgi:hypothetical protein
MQDMKIGEIQTFLLIDYQINNNEKNLTNLMSPTKTLLGS